MPPTGPPPVRNDREPEPITRFAKEDGGTVKIDGAAISFAAERARRAAEKRPPRIVTGEFTPAMAPGSARVAVLSGGPADGVEARVPRGAAEHRVSTPRLEGAGIVGDVTAPDGKTRQKIVGGDFASAVYLITGERDDEGRAVFEFAGIE